MATNKKISSEALKDLLHPESFESESILSKDRELKEIPVTIDELVPWNRNPRIFRNPKYDEIKESIRISGLKQKPGITRRPGDSHYMIESGGNTRLQILKELVEEIDAEMDQIKAGGEGLDRIAELTRKRDSFYNIKCVFTPWEELDRDTDSEINLLAGHMVENELRGEMIFIERALAVTRLRKLFEEKESKELSARKLAEAIKSTGWTGVDAASITRYEYAVRELYDFLPIAFECGTGRPVVVRLRKYHTCIEQLWEHAEVEGKSLSGWKKIWQEALKECDGEVFDFNQLTDKIEARLAQALDCNITQITAELFRLGEKGADPADSLLNRAEESNVTPFAVPGSKVGNNSQHNSAATDSASERDADRYLDYEDHPSDFTELPSKRTIAARLEEIKQKAAAKSAAKGEHNTAAASGSANTAGSAAGNYGSNDSAGGYSSKGNNSGSSFEQEVSSAPVESAPADAKAWAVPESDLNYLLYAPLTHDERLIDINIRDTLSSYACSAARYLMNNINRILKELKIAVSDYMQLFEMKHFFPAIYDIQGNEVIGSETMKNMKKITGLNEKEIAEYATFFLFNRNVGYIIKTNPQVMKRTLSVMVMEDYIKPEIAFMLTKLAISIVSKPFVYMNETAAAMKLFEDRHYKRESQSIWYKGSIIEEITEKVAGSGMEQLHLHLLMAEEMMACEAFPEQKEQFELLCRITYRVDEINRALDRKIAANNGGEA